MFTVLMFAVGFFGYFLLRKPLASYLKSKMIRRIAKMRNEFLEFIWRYDRKHTILSVELALQMQRVENQGRQYSQMRANFNRHPNQDMLKDWEMRRVNDITIKIESLLRLCAQYQRQRTELQEELRDFEFRVRQKMHVLFLCVHWTQRAYKFTQLIGIASVLHFNSINWEEEPEVDDFRQRWNTLNVENRLTTCMAIFKQYFAQPDAL